MHKSLIMLGYCTSLKMTLIPEVTQYLSTIWKYMHHIKSQTQSKRIQIDWFQEMAQ